MHILQKNLDELPPQQQQQQKHSTALSSSTQSTTHNNQQCHPRTAPITSTVHFPFDIPSSPKSVRTFEKDRSLFTFIAEPFTDVVTKQPQSYNKSFPIPISPTEMLPLSVDTTAKNRPYTTSKHITNNGSPLPSEQHTIIDGELETNKKRKDTHLILANHLKQLNNVLPLSLNTEIINLEDTKNIRKDSCSSQSGYKSSSNGSSGSSGSGIHKHKNRFINSIRNLTNRMESKYNSNSKLNSSPAPPSSSSSIVMSSDTIVKRKASVSYDSYDSNASSSDTTMFPFDREAIDYKRIQRECFAVEDDYNDAYDYDDDIVHHHNHHYIDKHTRFPFNFDTTTVNDDNNSDDNCIDYEKPTTNKTYKNFKYNKYGYVDNIGGEQQTINNCGSVVSGSANNDNNKINDNIFQHYAKIAQEHHQKHQQQQPSESIQMYEKRSHSQRNSSSSSSNNSNRKKYVDRHSISGSSGVGYCGTGNNIMSKSCGDAFTPNTIDNQQYKLDNCYTLVSKFDQIANKFNKIPPTKSSIDAFHNNTTSIKNKTAQSTTSSDYPSVHQYHHHHHHSSIYNNSSGSGEKIRVTSPVPNLRIDFFSETNSSMMPSSTTTTTTALSSKQQQQQDDDAEQLEICQKNAPSSTNAGNGSINVTSNPMDGAVCTQPRATIVVQQVRTQNIFFTVFFLFVHVTHALIV